MTNFSPERIEAQRKWNDIYKSDKKKKKRKPVNLESYIQQITFKNKGKIKTFLDRLESERICLLQTWTAIKY